MVERLLARLVGSSGWKVETSATDRNSLTVSDIAYALSGLSAPALLFCQIKYMSDDTKRRNLLNWLIFKSENHKFLVPMCDLAMREVLSPRICPACKGRQEVVTRKGLSVECRRCSGAGMLPWQKVERARACGMSKQAWRNWESRYEAIYSRLHALEAEVRSHIRNKLSDSC